MTTAIDIISQGEYKLRLNRLQEQMAQKKLGALLAFSGFQEREGHVAYLCNHRNSIPNVVSHQGWGHAALVIPAQGEAVLVAPGGYEADKVTNIAGARTGASLVSETLRAMDSLDICSGKVGVAGLDVIPAEYYLQLAKSARQVTLEKADELLENLRLVKSPAEIEILRQAAHAADAGLKAALEVALPGMYGYEIEQRARDAAAEAGADFVSRVRVCSGKCIHPHIWPQVDRRRLEQGDLVFINLVGMVMGYGFDCSRAAVAGKADLEQLDYLQHLAEATDWMINRLKPGSETFFLAESRGRVITARAHGIGLEIVEMPWVEISKPVKLKPGMVLCVEPMITSTRFGSMSVEDMVVITEDGVQTLNQLPRVNA